MNRLAVALLTGLIRFYQRFISPLTGPSCRFWPTCSEYAREAIVRHGALRGGGMAIWRLLRCGPWTVGGVDPVPDLTNIAPKA
ncbi:MAG: membrane protein insertion efficiency factor YidD [Calditrichaeota bacterium]|nr:membrane protein insertion efficiency factor YidD [Calditrichota bacterium]